MNEQDYCAYCDIEIYDDTSELAHGELVCIDCYYAYCVDDKDYYDY